MKKEDEDLLLKDLCGRLPYGVKCFVNYTFCNETTDYEDVKYSTVDTLVTINQQTESFFFEWLCEWFDIDEFKPYLFPLSSMTEEQKIECFKGTPLEIDKYGDIAVKDDFYGNSQYTDLEIYLEVIDWLNKNHFDYRGLIEKGLAIDATGLGIYE